MTLLDLFRKVTRELERRAIEYAVAGGLAVNVYRTELRATHDLDYAVAVPPEREKELQELLVSLGLTPHLVRKADLDGGPMFAIKRGNTPVHIIAGRVPNDPAKVGVDFLLSRMAWVPEAMERAQSHRIDFGFGPVPCLTAEDVVIAKLVAAAADSRRLKDLDDLRNLFDQPRDWDLAYLTGKMAKLRLRIPNAVKDVAPKSLVTLSRRIRIAH